MRRMVTSRDLDFLEELEAAGPFHAGLCFQCRKCTNGCPTSFAMDLPPDQVVRLAILGRKDEILHSRTLWVCASCETCTARCPNGVRIAELMDCFKEMALGEGLVTPLPEVVSLHRSFLDNLRLTGRMCEGALLPLYRMRSGSLQDWIRSGDMGRDLAMGWRLFRMGRLSLFPRIVRDRGAVREILADPPGEDVRP